MNPAKPTSTRRSWWSIRLLTASSLWSFRTAERRENANTVWWRRGRLRTNSCAVLANAQAPVPWSTSPAWKSGTRLRSRRTRSKGSLTTTFRSFSAKSVRRNTLSLSRRGIRCLNWCPSSSPKDSIWSWKKSRWRTRPWYASRTSLQRESGWGEGTSARSVLIILPFLEITPGLLRSMETTTSSTISLSSGPSSRTRSCISSLTWAKRACKSIVQFWCSALSKRMPECSVRQHDLYLNPIIGALHIDNYYLKLTLQSVTEKTIILTSSFRNRMESSLGRKFHDLSEIMKFSH